MRTELKTVLREALAGSSSQHPITTEKLYPLGPSRAAVESALLALYGAREVGCCKITMGEVTRVEWWLAGQPGKSPRYGRSLCLPPRGAGGVAE